MDRVYEVEAMVKELRAKVDKLEKEIEEMWRALRNRPWGPPPGG